MRHINLLAISFFGHERILGYRSLSLDLSSMSLGSLSN